MARINTAHQAKLVYVAGASGSGKSAWVKRQIARRSRVLVWDIEHEYSGTIITNPADLVRTLIQAKKGTFVFRPSSADVKAFTVWALAAFEWGNCVAVGEELAAVTSPGKAPRGWHSLVTRGRKRGITVIGVTQRPAEADKTLLGNATLIHCGRLRRDADRRAMAAEMDIPVTDIAGLKPLEWIESNEKGLVRKGKLSF